MVPSGPEEPLSRTTPQVCFLALAIYLCRQAQFRYNLGSTGSLSIARTPKTHSWTRRSGSLRSPGPGQALPPANGLGFRSRVHDVDNLVGRGKKEAVVRSGERRERLHVPLVVLVGVDR